MGELEMTWGKITRIWWSLVWRNLLFGYLSVCGWLVIVGFVAGMLRLDPQIGRALGMSAFILVIPVGLWVVKAVLHKRFKDFRIALVATAAIERQTEVIERLTRNFDRVFGSDIEKCARKIAAMTPEQRKELNRRVLAELASEDGVRRK
jgi:hypothetical protein